MEFSIRAIFSVLLIVAVVFFNPLRRWFVAWRYTRGRKEVKKSKQAEKQTCRNSLRWGNTYLHPSAATQHFLAIGTTGSGKSQIQKLLMRDPLRQIRMQSDQRAIVFDAKNDIAAYLHQIGVACQVFSFNPFEARTNSPMAVAWDIAKDITSPARAQNLAASLLPQEKGGNNQYFTDAARQVVIGVIESFIKHNQGDWTFADLVFTCLSEGRIRQILDRDSAGQEILTGFFGDDRTAYQVFTTICSRLSYFRPVAALWQRAEQKLSVREWLKMGSILVLGANATAKTSLDAINEQIFRVLVEEIDVQTNSDSRRTWVWIDEARLAGPLLKSDLLPTLAVKGRSRGVALVLAFQDIEGLREAAGERIANELVAQLSNKALLRMESDGSATWASKQLGQFESIEYFLSDNSALNQTVSGQRVIRDAVLASEFYEIKPSSRENGVTGFFISPGRSAYRGTISGNDIQTIVVDSKNELKYQIMYRPESDQWLNPWRDDDAGRLRLTPLAEQTKAHCRSRLEFKQMAN